jgi:branched-chain amino acid transport system substrate-binding protein
MGWKPVHYLNNVSISVGSVLAPAGLEKSVGIITAGYQKEHSDPRWANDAGMNKWRAFMKKYMPDGNLDDNFNVYGYGVGQTLVQVLKQSGDNLTRENVMRQAASLKNVQIDTLLPGITISTSPSDFAPIEAVQLQRFDGKRWELFGDVMSSAQ